VSSKIVRKKNQKKNSTSCFKRT